MGRNAKISIEKLRRVLSGHKEIVVAYLYGSLSRGQGTKTSDVDIGVVVNRNVGYKYPAKLSVEIDREVKPSANVDVRILNNRSPRFLNQVLRYGKIITLNDEKGRVKFETMATQRYIDFKHHYLEYDKKTQGGARVIDRDVIESKLDIIDRNLRRRKG